MNKGSKHRRIELERRDAAAMAIGHAVLACREKTQTSLCWSVLGETLNEATRSDVLLAMADQKIPPGPFQEEYDRELATERDRIKKAQDNAKLARAASQKMKSFIQHEAKFFSWLANQPGPASTSSVVPSDASTQKNDGVTEQADHE
ncbi:hypothetical protein [Lichenifustis flavocetrariae]|uniref:Uncharacterized protein n=1 Tax=Lichenifustis flavocetrariae TaxID=2949735 RepID=A0AA42CN43_9HYPH|nr:hypothetical protein [Lichenifustis flavocetrariae]MCW6512316.1 hypothetical protein [Lichenifustis flavocetrariae]